MPPKILQIELTTRGGNLSLGDFVVNEAVASDEAGIGRALYIGHCKEDRIISCVCNSVKNASRLHTVIATSSYDCCDSIITELDIRGIKCANSGKKTHTLAYDGSGVYISVLEKLYLAKNWHAGGFRPGIIHVVDHRGTTLARSQDLRGESRFRAFNIAFFKSVYEAHGIIPYPIYWTTEGCGCYQTLDICKCLGVEAIQYGNGKTVRTAGFISDEEPVKSTSNGMDWLQKVVHDSYVSRQNLVFVFSTKATSTNAVLKDFAHQQDYSVVDISTILISGTEQKFLDVQSAIRKCLLGLNRQVVVLIGTKKLWLEFQASLVLDLLQQICRHLTVICELPNLSLVPILKPEIDKFNNNKMNSFGPTFVDCDEFDK